MMNKNKSAESSVVNELEILHHLMENNVIADSCTEQQLKLVSSELALVIATGQTPEEAFDAVLEKQLIIFAEEHPALAEAFKQVVQTLGNIGI